MARQNGLVSWDTLTNFKADTTIDQQVGDVVDIRDTLAPGVQHTAREAGAETPDNLYTIRKTNDATKTFWAKGEVSDLIAGDVDVATTALPDNTSEEITVTAAGVKVGDGYKFGVVSGFPAGAHVEMKPVTTNDEVTFSIQNNTGAALTAGTMVVNIYK